MRSCLFQSRRKRRPLLSFFWRWWLRTCSKSEKVSCFCIACKILRVSAWKLTRRLQTPTSQNKTCGENRNEIFLHGGIKMAIFLPEKINIFSNLGKTCILTSQAWKVLCQRELMKLQITTQCDLLFSAQ